MEAKPLELGVPKLDDAWPEPAEILGNVTPGLPERAVAQAIIDNVPVRSTPLEIAWYFDQIGLGLKTGRHLRGFDRIENVPAEDQADLSRYVKEWRRYYSPLVVTFFDHTGRRPDGDCTAWCAAFVNWCMRKSREGHANSATLQAGAAKCLDSTSSQKYLNWGRNIDDPVLGKIPPRDGDIVVFKDIANPGFGHVGFYRSMNANDLKFLRQKLSKPNLSATEAERDYVKVLGGNQGGRRAWWGTEAPTCSGGGGGVTARLFPRGASTNLRFHSIRTDESLHSLWS